MCGELPFRGTSISVRPLKPEHQQKKHKRMFLVETYQITKAILSAHIEQEQTEQIQQITHIKQIQILPLISVFAL